MALNINDERADELAREVAKATGESLIEAIRTALEERLQRLAGRRKVATQRQKLYEILHRVDALQHVDQPSEDEILGYEERGLPR